MLSRVAEHAFNCVEEVFSMEKRGSLADILWALGL
jgi:hypothetical protein